MKRWLYLVSACCCIVFCNGVSAGVLGDMDGDGRVGLNEAIGALQTISGHKATIHSATEITIASGYVELSSDETEKTIMSVPADKTFVMTDLVGIDALQNSDPQSGFLKVTIKENEAVRFRMNFYTIDHSYHTRYFPMSLNAGIPFAPGSQIKIVREYGAGGILMSGYEIKN